MKILFTILMTLILLTGCSKVPETNDAEIYEEPATNTSIQLNIANQSFTILLEDNETTQALMEQLPLSLTMSEMNGNEKYYFLEEDLPANPQDIQTIHAGDFMLYQENCLVIFYETFTTSYRYTRLGHIEDIENLSESLGQGNIDVTFEIE